MAVKLRMTTAQSLIRKSQRVTAPGDSFVGIIDQRDGDRATTRDTVRSIWPEAMITEFAGPAEFFQCPNMFRFDLIIADVDFFDDFLNDSTSVANFLGAMKLRGAHVMILSHECQQGSKREFLIRQGADDVVAKPCLAFDLEHAVSKARISYYKNLELDRAESAAETDQLTGLANRRRLEQFLEALVTVYPDQHRPFSLVLLDVDNFKCYNDNHGHQKGDKVLQTLAGVLTRGLRRGDLAARFGGEEFLVVLPDCDRPYALDVAEKLRLAVEAADLPHQHTQPGGNLTATFGVATFPHDARDTEALFKQADECLYRGKHLGRNVVVAPD
jgi:diguanylate cyclase (GGDEF)-like protein